MGKRFGSGWFALAALGTTPLAAGSAVAAQEPGSPSVAASRAGDPGTLAHLRDAAEELTLNGSKDAEGRVATLAAWRALQDAAANLPLPDGSPHPLFHLARVKIASQLYIGGENALALEEVEAGLAGLRPHIADYLAAQAEGVALLGTLLAHGGDAESAMPLVQSGYRDFMAEFDKLAPDEVGRGMVMARSNLEFSLSQVALRLSLVEDALAYQAASLETREKFLGPDDPDTVASYYGYAGVLRRLNRMEEAEAYARTAVSRAVEHVDPSHPSYARSLEMLGIVLSRSGRPIEASDYLLRALELKREYEGTDNLVFGYGIHNLATIFLQRERYADAAPLFVEAEALFRDKQGEGSPFAIGSLAYAGQIDFVEGRYDQAIERLTALEPRLGEESADLEIAMRIAPDLISALVHTGDTAAANQRAERYFAQVAESGTAGEFELHRAALLQAQAAAAAAPAQLDEARVAARRMLDFLRRKGGLDARGFLQSEQRAALDQVMSIAGQSRDEQLMLSAMALIAGSDIARASSLRERREIEQDEELAEAIRRLQDADARVDAADRALLAALAGNRELAETRLELGRARDERDAVLAQLRERFPNWSAQSPVLDRSLIDLQRSLSPEEAILVVAPVYDGAYVLAVTESGAVGRRMETDRATLLELARRLRGSIAARQFDGEAALGLGRSIFTDEIRTTLAGKERLRILAGGPLASLPFSLLRWGDGEEDYLIDRFALSNISSLSPRPRSAEPAGERATSLVGFAGAQVAPGGGVAGAADRGASGGISRFFGRETPDFEALQRLEPLPQAAEELRVVAVLFDPARSTIHIGADASEREMTSDAVAGADVLLFATHGLVAGEIEGIAEPALVLALDPDEDDAGDGLLTASEIEQLSLSADWVILSACDSAAGMDSNLPAFSGLARAFRYAGANDLLVSHWQVRDDIAAYVTKAALRHYRDHGSKPEALRHAIRSLRFESGMAGSNRPEFWAPFVLLEN